MSRFESAGLPSKLLRRHRHHSGWIHFSRQCQRCGLLQLGKAGCCPTEREPVQGWEPLLGWRPGACRRRAFVAVPGGQCSGEYSWLGIIIRNRHSTICATHWGRVGDEMTTGRERSTFRSRPAEAVACQADIKPSGASSTIFSSVTSGPLRGMAFTAEAQWLPAAAGWPASTSGCLWPPGSGSARSSWLPRRRPRPRCG